MVSHSSFIVLLSLALLGVGLSQARELIPDEDYWEAVWPNTPIPANLKELLKRGAEDAEIDNVPMKIDDTQYPTTFFFDHDLYPGKIMKLEFSKHPYAQPYGVSAFLGKGNKDISKKGFTFEEACIRNPAGKGEHSRYCAKSLGSMIGFAISTLGSNIQVLSSSFVDNQNQYTVKGVQNLGDKAVMCHRLNFRKTTFYCHETHETTVYMVPLVAGDGTRTHALAVCHEDTSGMNAEILYQLLKVKPGTTTACHYLGNKAVAWVPNLAMVNANNPNIAG